LFDFAEAPAATKNHGSLSLALHSQSHQLKRKKTLTKRFGTPQALQQNCREKQSEFFDATF
jgi:hypothetical protein